MINLTKRIQSAFQSIHDLVYGRKECPKYKQRLIPQTTKSPKCNAKDQL